MLRSHPNVDSDKDLELLKAASHKPRGVVSAKVFGEAKSLHTNHKKREIEEKLRQREQDERKRLEKKCRKMSESKVDPKYVNEKVEQKRPPLKKNAVSVWRKKNTDHRQQRPYNPDGRAPPRRNDNRLQDRNFISSPFPGLIWLFDTFL